MTLATIEIQLEEDVAEIYGATSSEQKKKIQLLINLWLRKFDPKGQSLSQIMDDISDNAAARGMTPAILASLLNDNQLFSEWE